MPTLSTAATADVVVTNSSELMAALSKATGGERIVLKAGDYGNVVIDASTFSIPATAAMVTITSQDPGQQAIFTGARLQGVSNLEISNVTFDYHYQTGLPMYDAPFQLSGVNNVKLTNCTFDGDVASGLDPTADGYGAGIGLQIFYSTRVTVSGSELYNFHRGAVVANSSFVKLISNDIHDMSSDGLNFADVDNVVIKGNRIHDFHQSPDSGAHPDMIQFWTSGTTSPSTNIKILNNILDQGEGVTTQSIFMRNELVDSGQAGAAMYYQNIEISGNMIRNSHHHGITVGETTGLIIRNNTVLQDQTVAEAGTISIPSIDVATKSQQVIVSNNVSAMMCPELRTAHAGWVVSNNLLVQADNPHAANYAGHLFVDPFDHSAATLMDFAPKAGSLVDQLGVGAVPLSSIASNKLWGYLVTHETGSGGHIVQYFDASHILKGQTEIDLTGAQVSWQFGDGTSGSGLMVGHVYSHPGEYTAKAIVTLQDGAVLRLDKTFTVQSPNYLDLDFTLNALDHSPLVNAATLQGATVSGGALRLNGGTVSYQSDADFVYNDEFTIIADFKKDVGHETEGGRLIYKSYSFVLTLGADAVNALVYTNKGWVTLTASGVGIADSDWHRVGLTFSGETGRMRLMVDGVNVATKTGLLGSVQIGTPNEFYIGGPFGDSFGGQIDNVHFLGEALSVKSFSAADPVSWWERYAERTDPVVAGNLQGNHAVDLAATMTADQIADLFSNTYSDLWSGPDFLLV